MLKSKVIYLIFFICMLQFFSVPIFSKESQDCNKKIEFILVYVEQTWERRDGWIGEIFNDVVVELLFMSPKETLQWLTEKPKILKDFLEDMDGRVFVAVGVEELEKIIKKKKNVISILENFKTKKPELNEVRNKILKRVKETQIRIMN